MWIFTSFVIMERNSLFFNVYVYLFIWLNVGKIATLCSSVSKNNLWESVFNFHVGPGDQTQSVRIGGKSHLTIPKGTFLSKRLYQLLLCLTRGSLRKEGFVLAQSCRVHSPSWWGSHSIRTRHLGQETDCMLLLSSFPLLYSPGSQPGN